RRAIRRGCSPRSRGAARSWAAPTPRCSRRWRGSRSTCSVARWTARPTRAALARGLAQAGRHADAIATVLGAIDPDATPLLSLRDPAEPLAVLEASLAADRRDPEALVARELRAIAGGVDDAALVALVARRLGATRSVLLNRDALLARVAPDEAPRALFDLAAAIA